MAKVAFGWQAGVQAAAVAVAAALGMTWWTLSRTQNADHHEVRILAGQVASLAAEAAQLESLDRQGKLTGMFARQHARQLHDRSESVRKKIAGTRTGADLRAARDGLASAAADLAATLPRAPGAGEAPFVLIQQRADAIDRSLPRDPP